MFPFVIVYVSLNICQNSYLYLYGRFTNMYYNIFCYIASCALIVFQMASDSQLESTSMFGRDRQQRTSATGIEGRCNYNALIISDENKSLTETVVLSHGPSDGTIT